MPFSSGMTESYAWYAPGFHTPLAILTVDTVGTGTPYVNEAKYYTSTSATTGVGTIKANQLSITVAPNPVIDDARISFDAEQSANVALTITDMTGKIVYRAADINAGANNITFNTNNLPAGMYIVQLHTNNGSSYVKFAVTK